MKKYNPLFEMRSPAPKAGQIKKTIELPPDIENNLKKCIRVVDGVLKYESKVYYIPLDHYIESIRRNFNPYYVKDLKKLSIEDNEVSFAPNSDHPYPKNDKTREKFNKLEMEADYLTEKFKSKLSGHYINYKPKYNNGYVYLDVPRYLGDLKKWIPEGSNYSLVTLVLEKP